MSDRGDLDGGAVFTKNDADHRAALIWGHEGIERIDTRDDGGFDIHTRDRLVKYHRLNREGHATCHKACKRLEEFATKQGPRLAWEGGE